MKLTTLTQTYRSMQRMRDLVAVLSRHGLNQVLEATGLIRFVPVSQRFRRPGGVGGGEVTAPEQVRYAMEDLGPTFVKLGQMLSTRPDLVPEPFVEEFKKLQESVRPFPFEHVEQILEAELGGPWRDCFVSVDKEPLAAASMGQVHRARRSDGSRVVLKVRRPGLGRVISQDLAMLQLLVGAVEEYVPESRDLDLRAILDEFSRVIRRELDFFLEAANTERIRQNFEAVDEVLIPEVHWDLTTEQLLVLDEVEGVGSEDPDALAAAGIDLGRTARIAARCFLKQVLDDGVFHGDLHAGNLLVTPDGRIALLDFGAVGFLSEENQESLGSFFLALLSRDYVTLADEMLKVGRYDQSIDERGFERDLREMIEPYHGRPLKDLRVGEILREGMQVALRHKIRMPQELVLLGRSTLAVEGWVRQLDPGLMILDEAMPFAKKLLVRRLDPKRQFRFFHRLVRDYRDFFSAAPSQLNRIFQRVLDSKLSINFVLRGYEKAIDEVDRSSNRISISLIISSLIVGSALIVQSGKGPMLWDFPVFGIIGFVVAGVMGFGLAIAILRTGKF